ncbi:MAG: hypothetical protein KDA52_20810 [Planctomycetaceae bacterium]|nr:hypothetical protein [Planctomycetaceae bacterium]
MTEDPVLLVEVAMLNGERLGDRAVVVDAGTAQQPFPAMAIRSRGGY